MYDLPNHLERKFRRAERIEKKKKKRAEQRKRAKLLESERITNGD